MTSAMRTVIASLASLSLLACSSGAASTQAPPPPAAAMPPPAAPNAAPPGDIPPAEQLTGTVLETMNAGGYTYLRLQTAKGDVWVAVTEFPAKTGERLTVAVDLPMRDFHSKTLNRDFPLLYFGFNMSRDGQAPAGMTPGHGSGAAVAGDGPVGHIDPAPGGLTVADIWAKRTSLAGKTVVVRGQVVKVNNNIMDRNWFHLQDGSGAADAHTNDLVVTTAAVVKKGEVVTISGVVAVDKDFGAGYSYDVIVESATITGK